MIEPRIFSTDEWGAKPATQSSFPENPANGIVIHHMENSNRSPEEGNAEREKSFKLARNNQIDHMNRGWADTGQHFTVSRGGVILEGRHGSLKSAKFGKVVRGSHAGTSEQNFKWFGIELEGDNRNSFVVTDKQWASLVELCAWLSFWGDINTQNIEPHNHFRDTTCPGHIVDNLERLQQEVQTLKDKIIGHEFSLLNLESPRIFFRGKMSTFGGPDDRDVGPDEGLALVEPSQLPELRDYFLDHQPPNTTGLARRLNPDKFYIACRWNYPKTPKAFLRQILVTVKNFHTGKSAQAKPVDWGPNVSTGRVADLSPGLADFLGLNTNDQVEVVFE